MFKAIDSPFLVTFDETFKVKNTSTKPPDDEVKNKNHKKSLSEFVEQLDQLQRILYAHDRHSILLIFQAMDAAGKDSTIRAVMSGVDPSGCQVFSFKQPSSKELDHDFLRRAAIRLPERGRIGIFNRSYYEEVLIVKVHPEILQNQKLPSDTDWENIWQHRYKSINNFEKHLARNGTVILKFWLNISKEEQRQRFLSRLEEPEKHWKFSEGDVKERQFCDDYMAAYEAALNATSKPWAPWYAIPADDKGFMRHSVAEIIVDSLASVDLHYPKVAAKDMDRFEEMRSILKQEKN